MKIRHPPGRAGRPWLAHRLDVATRGAELLDDKQRALLRERARLLPTLARAREQWNRLAGEAEAWLIRAALLGGERALALAAPEDGAPASVTVRWQTILGVTCPVDAQVDGPAPGGAALGASAALIEAARAHRHALEAAARVAVAERALTLVESELRATSLRRNAIRHRWIPAHERALTDLDRALEELEREDAARVRSISGREGRS
jgi:V/A-type H+-transporting ATPase subunit D